MAGVPDGLSRRPHGYRSGSCGSRDVSCLAAGRLYHRHDRHDRRRYCKLRVHHQTAAEKEMSTFEHRNEHFDRLFSTKNLFWLGQNTNHLPMHPKVRQALLDSIESEEWHAYAPPLGFAALLRSIVEDL